MAHQKKPNRSFSVGPLLWGAAATAGFYALIHLGVIQSELITRYFASHPVEYIIAGLFFFGLFTIVGDVNGGDAEPFLQCLDLVADLLMHLGVEIG